MAETTQQTIDRLQAILDRGAVEVGHGDKKVKYDFAAIKKRIAELKRSQSRKKNHGFAVTRRGIER